MIRISHVHLLTLITYHALRPRICQMLLPSIAPPSIDFWRAKTIIHIVRRRYRGSITLAFAYGLLPPYLRLDHNVTVIISRLSTEWVRFTLFRQIFHLLVFRRLVAHSRPIPTVTSIRLQWLQKIVNCDLNDCCFYYRVSGRAKR
jgi:hypothetical protein